MTAMRPETTSEHIARDMREGRFPEQSEPQMVADQTNTAPERTFVTWPNKNSAGLAFSKSAGNRTEYVRADLAAVPAQVRVKPLVWDEDGHGNFRAQSVRGGEGVDRIIEPQVIGDDRVTYEAWGIKDSFDDLSAACAAVEAEILSEILAAIEPQPDPRDEVIARLVEALEMMRSTYPYNPPCYGWQEQVEAHKTAKAAIAAAIAAAKAVQTDGQR